MEKEKTFIRKKSKFRKKIRIFLKLLSNKENRRSLNKNFFIKKTKKKIKDDSILKLGKKRSYSLSHMLIRLKSSYKNINIKNKKDKKDFLRKRKSFFSFIKLEKPKKQKLNFYKLTKTKNINHDFFKNKKKDMKYYKRISKQIRENFFLKKRNQSLKICKKTLNGISFVKKSYLLNHQKSKFSYSNSENFEFIPNKVSKKHNIIPVDYLKDVYKIKKDFFSDKIKNYMKK